MNTDIRHTLEMLERDLEEQSHLICCDAVLCNGLRDAITLFRRLESHLEQTEAAMLRAEEADEPEHDDSVKCCPDCEKPNQFGELCTACEREREANHDPANCSACGTAE